VALNSCMRSRSTGSDSRVVAKYVTTAVSAIATSIDIINLTDISNFNEGVLFNGLDSLKLVEIKIIESVVRYPMLYIVAIIRLSKRNAAVLPISIIRVVLIIACFHSSHLGWIVVDVTRTRAIREFSDLVFDLGVFVMFVRSFLVVVGMATGAGPCIGLPGILNGFVVILMTVYTAYVAIVVARVVTIIEMRIIIRRPALC